MTARYLTAADCAVYIGRTEAAVRMMVKRAQIPHAKVAGRIQFDKEKLDRWIERRAKRVMA